LAAGLVPGILRFRQAAGGAFKRARMSDCAVIDAVIRSGSRSCNWSRGRKRYVFVAGDKSKDLHWAIEI
jgi:hypothetical protein